MPTFFDALILPKDDKVPTNESNIFRGEEVDVLFMICLIVSKIFPLEIC